jgi:Zn-dependent M28 family amino/carboxypeptidase
MNKLLILSVFVLLTGVSISCNRSGVEVPSFNGERAFTYLEKQVACGPRVPGSEAAEQCRQFFYDFFDSLKIDVDTQSFDFVDPYSNRTLPLVNVVASITGTDPKADRIVLMAHYDSRPRAEYAVKPELRETPIDGANDGASGVAVLLELAALMAEVQPAGSVDLVLVDCEDWGKPGDHDLYMIGSREFANRGIRGKYRFGIVVDMIGDKSQQIYREGYSQAYCRPVNDMVWEVAADLGITTFHDSVGHSILDDHLSLNTGGVPTIDIIDFDYPFWHTQRDTPDKCSALALENVGRVLARIIYDPSLWPSKL